ncbi:unnamed protein product [Cuscuta europaea]|uniref:Transposase (putative) gypsy type domain-containing protein n=1 Tax=Cuscuta europaea TaxID=41803 RepID=A0A9P0ZRH6_CUSEU|nr:unnamed protein product [Cuscuta europaea]
MYYSSSSESEEMPLIRKSKTSTGNQAEGSSSQTPKLANTQVSKPIEQPQEDGCLSGDDLQVYNKGMSERPPRIALHFNRIRKHKQRLPEDVERQLSQLLPPPREYYAGFIRHPMRHRPGHVLVHLDALTAGLRFPLHSFIVEFLHRVAVLPAQFVPSTYRILTGFIIRCHELRITPSVDLFLYHYCYQPYWTTGYLKLVARSDRQLFTENVTPQADWEERFLFVRVGDSLPFPDRWNAYPVRDSLPRVDAVLRSQAESLRMGGTRSLRSFVTASSMLSAEIGVISPIPVRRSISSAKGKEKMIADRDSAGQTRKKRKGNDGDHLIPIDHVVDLTGPEVEPKSSVPANRPTPVLTATPIDDRMFVEFSNMGPRSEGRYLFGLMPSSMWCHTAIKVPPSFTNLTHWSDLFEAGHQEALKAGVYYHKAFLAAEKEMKALASDRDDSQVLLSAARKLATDLQEQAKEGEKAKAALDEMQETSHRRDRELKELRAKVRAAESAGIKFDKAVGDHLPEPYTVNTSQIAQQSVVDFQRGKALNLALENTARQFLGPHLGQFLRESSDPIKAGIDLLDSTPEGKSFLDVLTEKTVKQSQDLLLDRNLELILERFPKPFDPDELGFDDLFGNTYDRVMEKRSKAAPDDAVQAGSSQPTSSPNDDHPLV